MTDARGRMSNNICQRIADDIVLGHFAPGTRLEEAMLADRLGVSRTPVREALRQLSTLGLVECRPNRSATVARITEERFAHLFEAIGDLEAACARYAAMRMSEAERARLCDVHAQGLAAMQTRDVARYQAINSELHNVILEGSHNPELIGMTQNLQKRATAYRRNQFMQIARVAASHEEHCGIVEAILAYDAASAYRQMRAHVDRAQDAVSLLRSHGRELVAAQDEANAAKA